MQHAQLPVFQMRRPGQAMTIAERMRRFRKKHPGYDREYKAKRRAVLKAMREARVLAEQLAQAELQAQPALMKIPVPTVRLALPAPTVDPTLIALNEMVAKRAAVSQTLTIPIERSTAA